MNLVNFIKACKHYTKATMPTGGRFDAWWIGFICFVAGDASNLCKLCGGQIDMLLGKKGNYL
jgi:hypothetical protein